MDLKSTIYAGLKHNTNLLNFILFFIAKVVIESIDHLVAAIKELIDRFISRPSLA
jgi:hypothetical protein